MENKDIFRKALAFVLHAEGGYANDPKDHGGKTYKGITQGVYAAYLESLEKPVISIGAEYNIGTAPKNAKIVRYKNKDVVINITDQQIEDIYYKKYWLASKCDLMETKLAIVVFDTSVNMGTAKPLQYFKELGHKITAQQFLARRTQSYREYVKYDSSQKIYLEGWLDRINALSTFITQFK